MTVRAEENIGRVGYCVDVPAKYLQRAALRCSQLAAEGFFQEACAAGTTPQHADRADAPREM